KKDTVKWKIKIHSKLKDDLYWLRPFFSVSQPGSCQFPFPMSVSQITQSLYLSGVDAIFMSTSLSRRNITPIVNVTAEHPCPLYEGECLQVPILDQPHALLACHLLLSQCIHNNRAPEWGSGLRHCISVLEPSLQTPGLIPGCITTGRDWESHRAAHNFPSVVRVWLVWAVIVNKNLFLTDLPSEIKVK
ncbi:unnamed protein product, partial [Coregonus sp. 'balchen']